MPKVLTQAQIDQYRDLGYVTPIRAIDEAEALACRRRIEAFEAETGKPAVDTLQQKSHLYFDWLWKLSRHPVILGALEDLIGPDILVMASRFWIKEARDRKFVGWHQDLAYFGLDPKVMVTMWLALTPVTRENGCMHFLPGSHKGPQHVHTETANADSMLSRGQEVRGLDTAGAIEVLLRPGEFSLHDGELLHNSDRNLSGDRRIGYALMVFPTSVRSTQGRRSMTLLAGTDRHGHWDHDPMPTRDRDPVIWELMNQAHRRYQDRSITQEALANT